MKRRLKKYIRKISKRFSLTKREKFALTTLALTLGLLTVQLAPPSWRYGLTAALVVATYFASAWGLREDLSGIEWLTLLVLPTMYAGTLTLFYFLLPVRWLTRLPTAIVFALGMYAILLVENIYNVAAIRTIQLLRAAHSVGFLLTLFTALLLFNIIISLHLPFFGSLFLVFVGSFPLILQSLWAMKLEAKLGQDIFIYTLVIALVLAEFSFVFSFWPIQTVIEGLFLTTVFYSLVGLVQQHIVGRLFRRTATEFIAVSAIVFFLVLLTTRWGG